MSAVHPTHHRIDGRDSSDDASDLTALTQRRGGLQVGEGRVAEVDPIGAGAAVADDVRAELTSRGLDRDVRLAGRDGEALGDELEVVDQRLHGLTHDVPDVVEA